MTPPKATFAGFEKDLAALTQKFSKHFSEYMGTGYNEARLREDFLNPLFAALGWDLANSAGLIQSKREVEIESVTRIRSAKKRADYLFRIEGRDRFVCEAKKPREDLNKAHIFQAKRYAWNKDVPVAVLTDFEEIKIFIIGARPDSEEPAVGELRSLRFTDYQAHARFLWDHLSRESVAEGFLDRLIDDLPKKAVGKGRMRQGYLIRPDRTRALDADFLNFLDEARRELASSLVRHNSREVLADGALNAATQRILDRILFLRICEDRDIDTGTRLQSLLETWQRNTTRPLPVRRSLIRDETPLGPRPPGESLYRRLVSHFRALDRRPPGIVPFFNGQIFKKDPSEDLEVGDDFLTDFLLDISDESSPYLFNAIPVEILGSVYERFLGSVVRLQGRGVSIEEKPEVRKAGGVYYTPRYIVDYIVEQTVGRLLDDVAASTDDLRAFATRTAALRFLDPACGSGSFLLRVFERVCEHWETRLTRDLTAAGSDRAQWIKKNRLLCRVDADTGAVHLSVELKRRILTENVHGVDLDAAAVEVTQLSLYLKMLEDETRTTLRLQRELLPDEDDDAPLLPALNENIKCGNSLIASDFSVLPDDLVRVNAFDWPVQFPRIMKNGGFHAVVGNPPYLNIDDTWGKGDIQLEAIKVQYPHIYNDKTDLLFYFIAKAYALTSNRVGFIVSRAFLEAFKADKLRAFLAEKEAVARIVDFQNFQVFDRVGITTCILELEKEPASAHFAVHKLLPERLPGQNLAALLGEPAIFETHSLPRSSLAADVWTFAPPLQAALNAKVDAAGDPLGEILHVGKGMETGCNEVFGERTLEEMGMWKVPPRLFRFRASNSDIQRYEIRERGEVLLWVEDCPAFEKLPAGLRKHLEACAPKLKARAAYVRGNCDWWRFTWPLHRDYYSRPRIISPFLAKENRFALVENGAFIGLTDTIVLFDDGQPESLKYLLGLLNSRLLTVRFRTIGKLKGGGIYEYFWNSVSKLPIRRIDLSDPTDKARHDGMVALVEKMQALMPRLRGARTEAERSTLRNAVAATEENIDALVYELYGLTSEEIALVEGAAG